MPAIQLEKINFVREKRPILENIDWSIGPGENWALIGPNGCGKSTLLGIILGLLWPSSGRVTVLNQEYGRCVIADVRQKIGFFQPVQQSNLLQKKLTALEIVITGFTQTLGLYQKIQPLWQKQALELLERAGLGALAFKPYHVLSSGERRRVAFLRVLCSKPEIILLDEPFESLDFPTRERFMKFLGEFAQSQATLILVTHRPEEVIPQIHQVALLKSGEFTACGPKEKVLTSENMTQLYEYPTWVKKGQDRFYLQSETT